MKQSTLVHFSCCCCCCCSQSLPSHRQVVLPSPPSAAALIVVVVVVVVVDHFPMLLLSLLLMHTLQQVDGQWPMDSATVGSHIHTTPDTQHPHTHAHPSPPPPHTMLPASCVPTSPWDMSCGQAASPAAPAAAPAAAAASARPGRFLTCHIAQCPSYPSHPQPEQPEPVVLGWASTAAVGRDAWSGCPGYWTDWFGGESLSALCAVQRHNWHDICLSSVSFPSGSRIYLHLYPSLPPTICQTKASVRAVVRGGRESQVATGRDGQHSRTWDSRDSASAVPFAVP